MASMRRRELRPEGHQEAGLERCDRPRAGSTRSANSSVGRRRAPQARRAFGGDRCDPRHVRSPSRARPQCRPRRGRPVGAPPVPRRFRRRPERGPLWLWRSFICGAHLGVGGAPDVTQLTAADRLFPSRRNPSGQGFGAAEPAAATVSGDGNRRPPDRRGPPPGVRLEGRSLPPAPAGTTPDGPPAAAEAGERRFHAAR